MRLFCTGEGKAMKLKKLIAIPAIAIAAGIGLAACGSNSAPVAKAAAAPSSAPAATHSAAAKPAVPGIGQPVKAGVFTFTVTKFRCGLTALGQPGNGADGNGPGGLSAPLHGQFCVVVVSETNTSNQPQPVPFDAQMTGTNGSTYTAGSDPTVMTNAQIEYLGQNYNIQSDVNPGTTYQDTFYWDVPANVSAATITLNSGFDASSATVNVH